MIWHTFFQPFIEFGFMRRALVVCLALSLSTTMLGVFLLLRRMSLMGDALSHAILPGVAVGYLLSGMSLLAMTLGGFISGIVVALVAGWVPKWWVPCGTGPSCSEQRLEILNGIQIPWLSLLAFIAIVILLFVYLRKSRS